LFPVSLLRAGIEDIFESPNVLASMDCLSRNTAALNVKSISAGAKLFRHRLIAAKYFNFENVKEYRRYNQNVGKSSLS
jgi:hypothetical protein